MILPWGKPIFGIDLGIIGIDLGIIYFLDKIYQSNMYITT